MLVRNKYRFCSDVQQLLGEEYDGNLIEGLTIVHNFAVISDHLLLKVYYIKNPNLIYELTGHAAQISHSLTSIKYEFFCAVADKIIYSIDSM